jgi:hypothetical protein
MTHRATAPPPSPPHACHALHVARALRLLCTLRVSEQCSECDARRCPNLRGPTRLWCEPEREADLAAVGGAHFLPPLTNSWEKRPDPSSPTRVALFSVASRSKASTLTDSA